MVKNPCLEQRGFDNKLKMFVQMVFIQQFWEITVNEHIKIIILFLFHWLVCHNTMYQDLYRG